MRAFLLALLLFDAAVAHADQASVDRAKAHLATAQRMFEVQQYGQAIEELQKAYVLDPKPEYLYALGQAFRLSGECAKAIKAYERYIKTNPGKDEIAKATTHIDHCTAELAKPPPPPPEKEPPPPTPAPTSPPPGAPIEAPTWKTDVVGHALVVGGVLVAGVGATLYLTGRSTIRAIDDAPTYDAFVERRASSNGAELRQRIGIATLVTGAVLIGGGIWHYTRVGARGTLSAAIAPDHATVFLTRSF